LRLWPLLLFGCSFAAIPHYFGIGRLEIWKWEQPDVEFAPLAFVAVWLCWKTVQKHSSWPPLACGREAKQQACDHAPVAHQQASDLVQVQMRCRLASATSFLDFLVPPPTSSQTGPWFACTVAMAGRVFAFAFLLSLSCGCSHSSGYQGYPAHTREMGEADSMWVVGQELRPAS
jgi:hypothetical protein